MAGNNGEEKKKKEIIYIIKRRNTPSPEAVMALHVYMLNLMEEKIAEGLI